MQRLTEPVANPEASCDGERSHSHHDAARVGVLMPCKVANARAGRLDADQHNTRVTWSVDALTLGPEHSAWLDAGNERVSTKALNSLGVRASRTREPHGRFVGGTTGWDEDGHPECLLWPRCGSLLDPPLPPSCGELRVGRSVGAAPQATGPDRGGVASENLPAFSVSRGGSVSG